MWLAEEKTNHRHDPTSPQYRAAKKAGPGESRLFYRGQNILNCWRRRVWPHLYSDFILSALRGNAPQVTKPVSLKYSGLWILISGGWPQASSTNFPSALTQSPPSNPKQTGSLRYFSTCYLPALSALLHGWSLKSMFQMNFGISKLRYNIDKRTKESSAPNRNASDPLTNENE